MPHITEQYLGFPKERQQYSVAVWTVTVRDQGRNYSCCVQGSLDHIWLTGYSFGHPNTLKIERRWQAGVEGQPVRQEPFPCEERLWPWRWLSWEKGWLWGRAAASSAPLGGMKEVQLCSSQQHVVGVWEQHKMTLQRLRMKIRKSWVFFPSRTIVWGPGPKEDWLYHLYH